MIRKPDRCWIVEMPCATCLILSQHASTKQENPSLISVDDIFIVILFVYSGWDLKIGSDCVNLSPKLTFVYFSIFNLFFTVTIIFVRFLFLAIVSLLFLSVLIFRSISIAFFLYFFLRLCLLITNMIFLKCMYTNFDWDWATSANSIFLIFSAFFGLNSTGNVDLL